jgi:hypothetical protein
MKKRFSLFHYRKSDCTELDLPHNRREQFLDMLKNRYATFLLMGFILLLFAFPLIAISLVKNILVNNMVASLAASSIDETSFHTYYFVLLVVASFLECLFFLLLSIPFAGFSRIYKRLSFGESLSFKEDFSLGVKGNGRSVFLGTLLLSGVVFLSLLPVNFITAFGNDNYFLNVLAYSPLFLTVVIAFPTYVYHIVSGAIYDNTFKQNIRNSFLFYAKSVFSSLGISLLELTPFVFIFISNIYWMIFGTVVALLVVWPLAHLFFTLHANFVFDLNLNTVQYPSIVNKGLYPLKNSDDGKKK